MHCLTICILPIYFQALSHPKNRLQLNFRPSNIYSKGMHADRIPSAGVLLRVKVKRRGSEVKTEKVEVVGTSDSCYRFQNCCDFEMLPVIKRTAESTAAAELIYDDLIPTVDDEKDEWLKRTDPVTPLFCVPETFCKYETISNRTLFKEERNQRICRKSRECYRFDFNLNAPLPKEPPSADKFNPRKVSQEDFNTIKQLFESRPVWSTNLLRAETKISVARLKYALPFIAYFYVTGPWRNLWLALGYDPRKDFSSRNYQMMDLRLNKRAVFNIEARTLEQGKKHGNSVKRNVVTQLVFDEDAMQEAVDLYTPVFAKDKFHHLSLVNFLQYCDLDVPKIKEMLDMVPAPQHGGKCTEKTGWLPAGFEEQCRGILFDILREHFQMEMRAKLNEDGEGGTAAMMMEDEEEEEDEDDDEAFDE